MKKILINDNWTFSSDIDPTVRTVHLPHDAMQTEKRVPGLKNGSSSGFYPGGKYTYVKTLKLSEEEAGKTLFLEFEGVYMKSSVYMNGELVGGHVYGYTDFYADVTGKVRAGANELKVIADNSQVPNSRWYSGSGIYRDVYLHMADREYICPDGIKVTTRSISPARVHVEVKAEKSESTQVRLTVLKGQEMVASAVDQDTVIEIPNAALWSEETPELYTLKVELVKDGVCVDMTEETFGIRFLSWDSKKGLQVNGKTVKLRGGCIHHDHSIIGTPEFDVACMRKMMIMKEAGYNAVRIAHHPASKAMLRACDALGMYMMNESFDTWLGLKSPYDYAMYFEEEWKKDLGQMVTTSYNHPSVIMYSIGNEVYLKNIDKAIEITRDLTAFIKSMDKSRPVLNALNPLTVIMGDDEHPEKNRDAVIDPRETGAGSGLAGSQLANTLVSLMPLLMRLLGNEKAFKKRNELLKPLDIVGFNYGDYLYAPQHKDFPDRILCGSETYPSHIAKNWKMIKEMPWVVGDFMWTSWEYLGEASVGRVGYDKKASITSDFPYIAGGCANIDLTGMLSCQGYFTKIVYGLYDRPYIAVHPVDHAGQKMYPGQWRMTDAVHSWSWDGLEGRVTKVDVYADAASVELFQDSKSLGRKKIEEYKAVYDVAYKHGKLKAVSYDEAGKVIGEDVITSADQTVRITAVPEKTQLVSGRRDLCYIPIELTDGNGVIHMLKDREIQVEVEGAAELMAVGSASLLQESKTPYTGNTMTTYQGRAIAILRTTDQAGDVFVKISAKDINSVEIRLVSR